MYTTNRDLFASTSWPYLATLCNSALFWGLYIVTKSSVIFVAFRLIVSPLIEIHFFSLHVPWSVIIWSFPWRPTSFRFPLSVFQLIRYLFYPQSRISNFNFISIFVFNVFVFDLFFILSTTTLLYCSIKVMCLKQENVNCVNLNIFHRKYRRYLTPCTQRSSSQVKPTSFSVCVKSRFTGGIDLPPQVYKNICFRVYKLTGGLNH